MNFLVCLLTLKLFISQHAQAVMAVIVWYLDLNLPIQSVPDTINVVSLNPAHGKVYSIQHYVIKFVSDLQQVSGFFPDTLVSSKKKTDRWNIVESGIKHHNSSLNPPEAPFYTCLRVKIVSWISIMCFWYHNILMSECCFKLSEQYFSSIIARTSYISMRWYPLCTRPIRLVGFL